MPNIQSGNDTAGLMNVDADFNARVNLPGFNASGTPVAGGQANAPAIFSENDDGVVSGARGVLSPETDSDYRMRVAQDVQLDTETFNYTAQNTGKHSYLNTSITAAWTASGLQTNSANSVTITTGLTVFTRAQFPVSGATGLICEFDFSFSNQPVTNTTIDIGLIAPTVANPYTPTDGAYFRLTSAGLFAVTNNNGVETVVALPLSGGTGVFAYATGTVYRALIQTNNTEVTFWINNALYATIPNAIGQSSFCRAAALSFGLRHAIAGGAASAALQALVGGYRVFQRGPVVADSMGTVGNRMYGSYQGLSGGTMGSLATYANSAIPTAALPTNTALTANLISGLGGNCIETDTLAVNTDGLVASYQIPAGSATVPGRRLRVDGIRIESFVQTALTGGGYNAVWTMNFGGTAVSLATAEAASAKARRVVPVGCQTVASGAVALTAIAPITLMLNNPIYVNPGEFFQVAKKKIGTAPSAGAIYHVITLDYSWE